mgnify:CR=1 FL=1
MVHGKTADELYRLAIRAGLYPGAKVRIATRVKNAAGERLVRDRRRGVVVAVYPYIFTCEVGGKRENYRYNELFGDEAVRVALQGVRK